MPTYIALIHKNARGCYGISFPDFPGCTSAANYFPDVLSQATEALNFHIKGMNEDGTSLPEPSSFETIMADPENRGAAVMLVPVTVRLVERLLNAVRAYLTAEQNVEDTRYSCIDERIDAFNKLRAARKVLDDVLASYES